MAADYYVCAGCGGVVHDGNPTSPGEVDEICATCWATEDVGDPFGEWLKGAWPA